MCEDQGAEPPLVNVMAVAGSHMELFREGEATGWQLAHWVALERVIVSCLLQGGPCVFVHAQHQCNNSAAAPNTLPVFRSFRNTQ